MKFYALILSCFLFFNGFSQTKDEFIPGAYLVENNLHEDVKSAKSILIVISGQFDHPKNKAQIEKKLKELFKVVKMKVKFTYWSEKKEKFTNSRLKTTDFEVVCYLTYRYLEQLNEYTDHRRQFYTQWAVKCEKGNDAASLGNATIDVFSLQYLNTEEKAVIEMILGLFTK